MTEEPGSPKGGQIKVSKQLVFVNSVSAVAARILNISVLVWVQQYLLRRVSPDEYSLLPVVTSLMLLVPLISYALTSGFGRFVTAAYDEGRMERVTSIVSTVFPVLLGAATLLTVGGLGMIAGVEHVIKIPPDRVSDARVMLGFLVVNAATNLLTSPFIVAFVTLQRFVLKNLIEVSGELFRMGLLAALLLGVGPRVIWVVISECVAGISVALILAVISRRWMPALRFARSAIDWSMARELMSFGAWGFVIKSTLHLRATLNPIVLNRLSTPLDVACFHLGTIAIRQIQSVGNNAAATSVPMLTALFVRGDREGLRQSYLSGNRYSMWLAMAIAMPLSWTAPEVIRLYAGEEYSLAAWVLILSFASFPPRYAATMIPRLAHASRDLRPFGLAHLATNLIDLLLAIVLVVAFGHGAIGVSVAGLISSWIFIPLLQSKIGIELAHTTTREFLRQAVFRGLIPTFVSMPVFYLARTFIVPETWLGVVAVCALGTSAYGLALVTLALTKEERSELRDIRGIVERKLLKKKKKKKKATEESQAG